MSSDSALQARYDSLVQEIYKDILKKEGFVKAHGRRHVLFEFAAYGILGVGACLVTGEWFIMAFVSILYYMIILEDMDLSDVWFRRLLFVPVAELLVMGGLFFLIWQEMINSFVAEKVCIGLFLSGFVHLVDYLYNRHVRKKLKKIYSNRRFWGGA